MPTIAKAWASAVEALVAGAMAMAADAASSADWAMAVAMEATDMAATAHHAMEDMAFLAYTKNL